VPRPDSARASNINPTEWKEHVRSDSNRSQQSGGSVAPYAVDAGQTLHSRSKSRGKSNPTGRNVALRDSAAGGGSVKRAHVNHRMRDSRMDPMVSKCRTCSVGCGSGL